MLRGIIVLIVLAESLEAMDIRVVCPSLALSRNRLPAATSRVEVRETGRRGNRQRAWMRKLGHLRGLNSADLQAGQESLP